MIISKPYEVDRLFISCLAIHGLSGACTQRDLNAHPQTKTALRVKPANDKSKVALLFEDFLISRRR